MDTRFSRMRHGEMRLRPLNVTKCRCLFFFFRLVSSEKAEKWKKRVCTCRAGCAGAISSRPAPEGWSRGYVMVDDTLSALQDLAANVRDRFEGPVVGITGSVGKTTTRSLTGAKRRTT